MKKTKLEVMDLTYIALFTAITCAISQLPGIPLPGGVPMTLQTLIIPLAGIILGPFRGTIAILLYVLLGAVGLPVFSGFSGGLGVLVGATGGFLLSFPLMPIFSGWGTILAQKNKRKTLSYFFLYLGLVIGAVLNYLIGTLWFAAIYLDGINAKNLAVGFTACVLPFIPTSILKIVLCGVVGLSIRQALQKAHLLNRELPVQENR